MFKSYPFEEFWTKPQNLGAPVNSRYDDYGFTKFSDQESYFISDRVGGKGLSDVYYLNLEKARDFFSIPTNLINQYAISEIILEDLSSGEKEVYIPEETKALHLDISENGYKVSWEHLGLTKHIIITGKKDKSGEYEIYLKGLEGLEPKNFISGIEILGKPNPVQIKIDQKVWTYLSPKDQLAFSQNETEVPNYISGADEIIQIDEFGNEVRKKTFPPAKPFHKEIFYLEKPKAEEINSFYQQIDRLLEAYEKNETKESVAITLVLSEERIPAEMERFGEKAERYLLENGVEQSKINLSWVNETSILETKSRSSNFEIFITANSQLSFVE